MAETRWKDITGYSRGESAAEPRSWQLSNGRELRVVVTRRHPDNERWYVRCEPFFEYHPLIAKEANAAKVEALTLCKVAFVDAAKFLEDCDGRE